MNLMNNKNSTYKEYLKCMHRWANTLSEDPMLRTGYTEGPSKHAEQLLKRDLLEWLDSKVRRMERPRADTISISPEGERSINEYCFECLAHRVFILKEEGYAVCTTCGRQIVDISRSDW